MDVYHKWLSIPPGERPPNHYRLLGLARFERDSEVIANAAARQTAYVETHRDGPESAEAERLLSELAAARRCLTDPNEKYAYDCRLRDELARDAPEWSASWTLAMLAGAFRYYAAIARRAWLWQTQLEPAYWRLGVEAFHDGRYRDRVPDAALFDRIAALTPPRSEPPTPAGPPPPVDARPTARRFAWVRVAGRFVARAGAAARDRWRQYRRNRLLVRLGREVYRLAGAEAGPVELIDALRDAHARMDDVNRRLDALAQRKPGRRFSPQRMAWLLAGAFAVVLLLLWFLLRIVF